MSTHLARAAAALTAALTTAAPADVSLPGVLSDHMVLQRDEPVAVWGWAAPDETVQVAFGDQRRTTRAGADGTWTVTLAAMPASAVPRTLTVRGADDAVEVEDVLVGEVWICSGQSNMVWTISGSQRAEAFIAGADDPRLRLFKLPNTIADAPREDCPGSWSVASPETVGRFSAVAYHFGRNVLEHLDVPVGLISTNWGGSTVEAWISRPVLEGVDAAAPFLATDDAFRAAQAVDVAEFIAADLDTSDWETVELPALIEDLGHDIDGIVWFRRSFEIPAGWAGRPLTLTLGTIDDNDVTYFDGTRVGATSNWQMSRVYDVPPALVRAGTATIAVRVEDTGGAGGFSGAADDLALHPRDAPDETRTLAGGWKLRVASESPPIPRQHRPANLYNAMVHPLRHYAVRGAVWYQGESNAIRPRGEEYFTLFPAMIRDWRRTFERPDLPFYFVQLPNFTRNEADTIWRYPTVRQAQLETMRAVPHTGMAVTLDLGEADDIHPRNKHDVGERLARWALVDTYGASDLVKSGPIFRRAEFRGGGAVHVLFDLYGSELALREGAAALAGFEMAGPDGVFRPARAMIDGGSVVLTAAEVPDPVRVRYAWRNNAADATLVNAEGWPASPFVTGRE